MLARCFPVAFLLAALPVRAQFGVANPTFDRDLGGWSRSYAIAEWNSNDSSGNTNSGSVRVSSPGAVYGGIAGLQQCVSVPGGSKEFILSMSLLNPTGQPFTESPYIAVVFHSAPGCHYTTNTQEGKWFGFEQGQADYWTHYTGESAPRIRVKRTAESVNIVLGVPYRLGMHAYFDNIRLYAVDPEMAGRLETEINEKHASHGESLPLAMEADAALEESYLRAQLSLSDYAYQTADTEAAAKPVYGRFFMGPHASLFRQASTGEAIAFDLARERVLRTMRDLYDADLETFIEVTALGPDHASLLRRHSVLLQDGSRLSAAQLSVLDQTLASVQKGNLRSIAVPGFFPSAPAGIPADRFFSGEGWEIAIEDIEPGQHSINPFPAGETPRPIDGFLHTLLYRIARVTDDEVVSIANALADRRDDLLVRAACSSANYLADVGSDGCAMQTAPETFLATMAMAWFADAESALALAIERFDAGRPVPLETFLLLTEVFGAQQAMPGPGIGTSDASVLLTLYRVTADGHLESRNVRSESNGAGRITMLVTGRTVYRFTYDQSGALTGVQSSPALSKRRAARS